MNEELVKKIENLVTKHSYFELDNVEDEHCSFTTRENGNVHSETPSKIDILEARKLKKIILENFEDVEVYIETCDEWVNVNVSF
jgi:hypothetical protein